LARFTDKFVASADPGEHTDELTPGLMLWVRPSTSRKRPDALRRSWVLRIAVNGKTRKIGLGPYPLTSLAEARRKATEARQALLPGLDPSRAGRASAASVGPLTFSQAANQFLADVAIPFKNPRDETNRIKILKVHCAGFNTRAVDKITPREVAQLLKGLSPETAVKTKSVLHKVFSFAAVELAQRQPQITMRVPTAPDLLAAVGWTRPRSSSRGHQPAADYRKMPEIMSAMAGIPTVAARCAEFLTLAVARSGAARLAQFSQIDLVERVWRVPPELLKDGSHRSGPMVVPLSPAALAIVERMRVHHPSSPFIFAGDDGAAITEMPLATIKIILRRVGGWTDPDSGKPISLHGMRSSFRTWVETTRRQDAIVAELAMGHKTHGAVEGRYVRGDGLLSERRKLLDAWADHCFARSNVVSIRSA
jgi:integrase